MNSSGAMLKRVGIRFPIPLPLLSSPPDKKAMDAWVECHKSIPQVREIAKKLSDNINYVSYETFSNQLKKTIADFNKKKKPYILWIPQLTTRDERVEGCSDVWVAGIALEHCGFQIFLNMLIRIIRLNVK